MKFKAKVYFNHQRFRALAIPADKNLEDLSEEVKKWIGPKVTEQTREFDTTEQLIGFDPQTVWDDFQTKGHSGFEVTAKVDVVG
nr:hypothetical protein [uncultured Pseudomonas sp.]